MTKRSMKSTIQQIRSKHGLTRRDFLKASAITTAAVGGITGLTTKLLMGKTMVANAASAISAKSAALNIWNLPAFTAASGPYQARPELDHYRSAISFPRLVP